MNADGQKAERIADYLSEIRVDMQGGYRDQWQVREVDGVACIIVAGLSHKGEPELTIMPVDEYIVAYAWVLQEMEEASEAEA